MDLMSMPRLSKPPSADESDDDQVCHIIPSKLFETYNTE